MILAGIFYNCLKINILYIEKVRTIFLMFQGHLSAGTKVLYDYLHKEPAKLMILGPFDNDLAKTVAAYAGHPDIGLVQVIINLLYYRIDSFPWATLS